MPSSSPSSVTNFPAFRAFVERQETNRNLPVLAAVANERSTAPTSWLYSERRDSLELHRARLGPRYTAEERELLRALHDVVSAGRQWASADTDTCTNVAADDGDRISEPLTARIYRTRNQGTLYRSHLCVMGELADELAIRLARGKAEEGSDHASPPPSGT